jgi:hypothetical protein
LGSNTCACNAGYTGDGQSCSDVNECLTNNGGSGANATCTNTLGSNTCACNAGFGDCDNSLQNGCEVSTSSNTNNCGGCGIACGSGQVCQASKCVSGATPCAEGTSGVNGNSTYVVCKADAASIWIGHKQGSGGQYDAGTICKKLGYNGGVTAYGGTCGNECGYCQGATSCNAPGNATFDNGGNQGANADGPLLGSTVMWQCAK